MRMFTKSCSPWNVLITTIILESCPEILIVSVDQNKSKFNLKLLYNENNKNLSQYGKLLVVNSTPNSHLKISIYNIIFMQVTKGRYDFCAIKSCPVFREDTISGQVEKQFSAIYILHHKTQAVSCLE